MSRARDQVCIIDLPNRWTWFDDGRSNRQRERKKSRGGKSYTVAVEMIGSDVEDRRPYAVDGDAVDARPSMRSLEPGTALVGVYVTMSEDSEFPIFALRTAAGADVGFTKPEFGRVLASEFGYRYPDGWEGVAVRGIRVSAVETVACDPRFTEASGMGRSGLWTVPRVTGLAVPEQG